MFQTRLAKEKWDELNEAIENAPIVVPCQNTDPDLWFSGTSLDDEESYTYAYRVAIEFCKNCPVRNLCLEYAMANSEEYGIWGGLTPMDRKRLRRGENPGRGKGRPKKA